MIKQNDCGVYVSGYYTGTWDLDAKGKYNFTINLMYNEKTRGYISEVSCSTPISGCSSPLMDSSKPYATEYEAILISLRVVYTYFNNHGTKNAMLNKIKNIAQTLKDDPDFSSKKFKVYTDADEEEEIIDLTGTLPSTEPLVDKQKEFKCRCVHTKGLNHLILNKEYIVEETREVKLHNTYKQCRIGDIRFPSECFELIA